MPQPIPPIGPSPFDVHYVATASALTDIVRRLAKEPVLGFDLEADSMFHFKEKICLIQIAGQNGCFIVDPLSITDASPLDSLLSDPAIIKIFHGADYDVRSLFRDFGIAIRNLFDTELACRFLGYAETGLDTVLKKRFNVALEKKYQKKDWSQRPLPPEMIDYAAGDVRHLIPLYHLLRRELAEKDRLEWVLAECADLTEVRSSPTHERPLFLKIKGVGHLDGRELAVLESLLEWRLSIAEQRDRPPFKIMGNETLLRIAAARPLTPAHLENMGALSRKQLTMYAGPLLEAVGRAMALPDDQLPRYPRSRQPRSRADMPEKLKALKQWREQTAARLQMDPGVLINNAALKSLAEASIGTKTDLSAVAGLKPWQQKAFGRDILKALAQWEATQDA